jgi:hypothetical protein
MPDQKREGIENKRSKKRFCGGGWTRSSTIGYCRTKDRAPIWNAGLYLERRQSGRREAVIDDARSENLFDAIGNDHVSHGME